MCDFSGALCLGGVGNTGDNRLDIDLDLKIALLDLAVQ